MCIVLHLPNLPRAGEYGLSAVFLAIWESSARWCSSCISPDARCLGAQIGVSIVKLDAGHRGGNPAGVARAETQAQAFAAPDSDRIISGFLWVDVPAGGGTGSDDFCAALLDPIAARRQLGIEQSQR